MSTVKPMSHKERFFARTHAIFLLRNIDKQRHIGRKAPEKLDKEEEYVKATGYTKKDVFLSQLTALKTARSVKTRSVTCILFIYHINMKSGFLWNFKDAWKYEDEVNKAEMFLNWLLTSLLCLLFRRLALAEENTELTQTARLAQVFNSVCRQVMEYKGKKRLILFTLQNVNVKLAEV